MKKQTISEALADTIRKATALNNKIRLKIVLAIFNTEVLKIGHSLTLSQLERMLKVSKQDLSYHMLVLKETNIINKEEILTKEGKKKTYYQTTKDCIDILKLLDITEEKIKELSRELAIPAAQA